MLDGPSCFPILGDIVGFLLLSLRLKISLAAENLFPASNWHSVKSASQTAPSRQLDAADNAGAEPLAQLARSSDGGATADFHCLAPQRFPPLFGAGSLDVIQFPPNCSR